jgi:hypothetical protein
VVYGQTVTVGRHPLYQAADMLKEAFLAIGFKLIDNGEGLEIEMADVTFPTWAEPEDIFAWQRSPIQMAGGQTVLRTRILPAHLKNMSLSFPLRVSGFGRVYQRSSEYPMRHQIEGLVAEEGLDPDAWRELWAQYAVALFGPGAEALLKKRSEGAYSVSVRNPANGKIYELGYTGPASKDTSEICGINGANVGWVFIFDVENFSQQLFLISDKKSFYENDVNFLKQFNSDKPSVGDGLEQIIIDALRELGYYETCGDTIYPDGIYRKMNMVQEDWDANNVGLSLAAPLGNLTGMRTTQTAALEMNLALNSERGVPTARLFEVSHIYLPIKGQILPKEHLSLYMAAYGDIDIETFTADVDALLRKCGVAVWTFVTTDIAIAYKPQCRLLRTPSGTSMSGNYGEISAVAEKNFRIKSPSYMLNLELNGLRETINTRG